MTREEAYQHLLSQAPWSNGSLYGYHSCSPIWDTRPSATWRVGIEAEKEDERGQRIAQRYQGDREDYLPHSWRAERDGSLGYDGFELISPVYNLMDSKVLRDIYDPVLGFLLNSNSGYRCGGHMTISKRDTNGHDLFKSIEPFVPLFYALFPKRAKTRGYAAFADKDMSKDNKYCAFHILQDRVEIRIFSAVKNVTQLTWRIELLRLIAQLTEHALTQHEVYQMLLNPTTRLHRHLAKVYTKKLGEKIMLTHAYTKAYQKEGVFTFAEYVRIKSKVPRGVFDGRVPVLPAKAPTNNSKQLTLDVCDYLEEAPGEA